MVKERSAEEIMPVYRPSKRERKILRRVAEEIVMDHRSDGEFAHFRFRSIFAASSSLKAFLQVAENLRSRHELRCAWRAPTNLRLSPVEFDLPPLTEDEVKILKTETRRELG
jgi:hypothetical protein